MSRNLLSNLDVNVSFTEDVIQSTCPEAVPYATAKERLLPVGYNKRNVKTSNYRESCYCHSPKQLFNGMYSHLLYMYKFLISLYSAPLAQKVSYLALHSFSLWARWCS